jgi:tetratricopeptide (TPR) repeat protein/ribosomal protein L37AE/L43A
MPTNFCPECGTRAVAGQKFCGECGAKFTGEPEAPAAVVRSDVSTGAALKDTVISRSTVKAGGAIEGSVVSRSDVRTQSARISDAVISHSTITQTETHQHFGESVGTYEAQMDLGRTAFEGKNWEEAVDFFNTALKIDARSHEPWFYKGVSCAELKRIDEAVTNLRRALKLAGEKAPPVLDDIRRLADRISRSATQEETAANDLLGKSRAELQYSVAYQQAAPRPEGGIVGKTLALDFSFIPVIGQNLRQERREPVASRAPDADRREEKSARLEEQAKGHLSEAVRLWNSSVRLCDLVLEFEKNDEFSWLKRGEIFFRLKLYDDACRSYESLLAFNPDHKDALRMRGMCFSAQNRPIPPPPGTVPAPEPTAQPPVAPLQQSSQGRLSQPAYPAAPATQAPQPGIPPAGPRSPLIPQPVPTAQPSVAPLQQSMQGRPAQPAYPAQAGPQQPAHMVQPPAYPSQPAPQQPVQAVQPRYPPQPGAYQTAPRPGPAAPAAAGANPCPFCRGEMSFVKERGVWQCGSCRQFSARPAR